MQTDHAKIEGKTTRIQRVRFHCGVILFAPDFLSACDMRCALRFFLKFGPNTLLTQTPPVLAIEAPTPTLTRPLSLEYSASTALVPVSTTAATSELRLAESPLAAAHKQIQEFKQMIAQRDNEKAESEEKAQRREQELSEFREKMEHAQRRIKEQEDAVTIKQITIEAETAVQAKQQSAEELAEERAEFDRQKQAVVWELEEVTLLHHFHAEVHCAHCSCCSVNELCQHERIRCQVG